MLLKLAGGISKIYVFFASHVTRVSSVLCILAHGIDHRERPAFSSELQETRQQVIGRTCRIRDNALSKTCKCVGKSYVNQSMVDAELFLTSPREDPRTHNVQ